MAPAIVKTTTTATAPSCHLGTEPQLASSSPAIVKITATAPSHHLGTEPQPASSTSPGSVQAITTTMASLSSPCNDVSRGRLRTGPPSLDAPSLFVLVVAVPRRRRRFSVDGMGSSGDEAGWDIGYVLVSLVTFMTTYVSNCQSGRSGIPRTNAQTRSCSGRSDLGSLPSSRPSSVSRLTCRCGATSTSPSCQNGALTLLVGPWPVACPKANTGPRFTRATQNGVLILIIITLLVEDVYGRGPPSERISYLPSRTSPGSLHNLSNCCLNLQPRRPPPPKTLNRQPRRPPRVSPGQARRMTLRRLGL